LKKKLVYGSFVASIIGAMILTSIVSGQKGDLAEQGSGKHVVISEDIVISVPADEDYTRGLYYAIIGV